jgi:hypothetical protein
VADPVAPRPPPLPLRRHLNGLVLGGLLSTLTIPIGSAAAEYSGEVWPNVFTLAAALTSFLLLALGLRLGPTKDSRKVARRGVRARAVIERAKETSMSQSRGEDGPTVAKVVLLDLRIEAEGEPVTRVRLRRWVRVDRLGQMRPGVALEVRILPGRPQDPALGLR